MEEVVDFDRVSMEELCRWVESQILFRMCEEGRSDVLQRYAVEWFCATWNSDDYDIWFAMLSENVMLIIDFTHDSVIVARAKNIRLLYEAARYISRFLHGTHFPLRRFMRILEDAATVKEIGFPFD